MPAKSKQQQKFFGVVRAMQKGDIPKKGEAGEVADDMKKPDVKKMASTKHKGLPKKVKEIIAQELVKELKLNEVKPIIDPKLVSKPNDRIQYVATNDHRYPSEIVFIDTQTGHVVFFNIQRKEVERIAWNKLNSTHWVRDYIEKEFEGFLDGHSPSGKIKYQGNVNEGAMSDIDIIRQNSEDLEQFIKDFDQAYGHKIKMSSKVAKWLKGLWDMGQEVDKKPDMDRIFQKGRRTSRLTDEGNYAWKQTFPIVDPSKIGNKINIARAKAHFKQGEKIAAINKKTKKAIRISHIDQLNKLSSSTYEFAYITESKLNEYGGSDFSKITSLQNFLTIDLDKFEKGLKDSKHKAAYKKARKQFMKVVSDVAWEHHKLHEGKINEVKLNKANMQYYALSYLKDTNTLQKISRKAYQTWMKELKTSYTREEAADSIFNLVKDAGLLPTVSKSKHQNWMKKFLGEMFTGLASHKDAAGPEYDLEVPDVFGEAVYKLGNKWSSDFDYKGMLQMGATAKLSWGLKKLNQLFDSYEDVNYHKESKALWTAIKALEKNTAFNDRHYKEATKAIKQFNLMSAKTAKTIKEWISSTPKKLVNENFVDYFLDRDENRKPAAILEDDIALLEFATEDCDAQFVYMYAFGAWYVYDIGKDHQFKELDDVLSKVYGSR